MQTRSAEARTDATAPWERFYGFGARPFSLTPDLRFAFHSRSHSRALQQLTDALRRREGMIVITGEIGTGKTMLCRTLLETFETRTFVSVILDPGLGVDDLLQQVLADFGLVPHPEPGAAAHPGTRHQMVTMLQRFLSTLIPLSAHAVVIVDEAQQVDPAVLEQLRLLTNFETDAAKLLQVVLVGQPNLDDVLARPDMRQLTQRVARRIELYPLSELEVQRYVEHRLAVASEAGSDSREPRVPRVHVTPDGLRAVAAITGGIPRVINTVCDRALEIGFERQTFSIDARLVNAAAERLKLTTGAKTGTPVHEPERAAAPGGETRRRPEPAASDEGADRIRRVFVESGGASPEIERAAPQQRRGTPARWAVAAAVMIGIGAGSWWMLERRSPATVHKPATPPPTTAAAPPPAPAPTEPAARSAPPSAPSSEPTETPHPPAPSMRATASNAPHYYIAVAAFRTTQRASEVAAALEAAGLEATVRAAPAGAWQQVVVGPFATTDEAAGAQPTLSRLGFTSTRVVLEPPTGR